MTKIKTQPRVRGVRRKQMSTAVNRKIERWIEGEMRRYKCARSFVIAVACAHAGNIDLDEGEEYA